MYFLMKIDQMLMSILLINFFNLFKIFSAINFCWIKIISRILLNCIQNFPSGTRISRKVGLQINLKSEICWKFALKLLGNMPKIRLLVIALNLYWNWSHISISLKFVQSHCTILNSDINLFEITFKSASKRFKICKTIY